MGGLGRKEKERTRFVLVSFRNKPKGFFFHKLRANAPDRLVCTCVDVHTLNVWGLTVGSVVGLKCDCARSLLRIVCMVSYLFLHYFYTCATNTLQPSQEVKKINKECVHS